MRDDFSGGRAYPGHELVAPVQEQGDRVKPECPSDPGGVDDAGVIGQRGDRGTSTFDLRAVA